MSDKTHRDTKYSNVLPKSDVRDIGLISPSSVIGDFLARGTIVAFFQILGNTPNLRLLL